MHRPKFWSLTLSIVAVACSEPDDRASPGGSGSSPGGSAPSASGAAAAAAGTASFSGVSGGGGGTGNAGAPSGGAHAGTSGSAEHGGSAAAAAGHAGSGGPHGGGGFGGNAGSAGGGGASAQCDVVKAEYAAELENQLGCKPGAASQCTDRVAAAPGCECEVFIEPSDPFAIEHLTNLADGWFTADCTLPMCPTQCSTASSGICQPDTKYPLGGRCLTP